MLHITDVPPSVNTAHSNAPVSSRQHLPGFPHWGGPWKVAVGILHKAIEGAVYHTQDASRFTVNQVGTEVIDHIGELDSRALCVLYVVLGDLIRLSKKGDHWW
jgi:hypothetical protein